MRHDPFHDIILFYCIIHNQPIGLASTRARGAGPGHATRTRGVVYNNAVRLLLFLVYSSPFMIRYDATKFKYLNRQNQVMVQKCPACKSENTELEITAQKKFLRCLDCQYDERIITAQIPVQDIENLVKKTDLSWHKPSIEENDRDQRVQWLAQEQQKLREQQGDFQRLDRLGKSRDSGSAFRSGMEREANQGRDANEKYTAEHSDKERSERELGPISYDASKARGGKGSMGYEAGKGGGGSAEYSSDSVHAKSYDEALAEACCSHPDVAKFHENVHKKRKDQYLV